MVSDGNHIAYQVSQVPDPATSVAPRGTFELKGIPDEWAVYPFWRAPE